MTIKVPIEQPSPEQKLQQLFDFMGIRRGDLEIFRSMSPPPKPTPTEE